jgi:TonB-dependent SusC/RagA subfamily outer membrane receptor
MEALSRAGLGSRHPTVIGMLALFFLTACATTPSAQSGVPADDSVDVGYGSMDKDQLTGSVSTVAGEDEATRRTRTLAEMLSRVPGVRVIETPGGGLSVRIRGNTSFLASEEPLFVIDGVVIQAGGEGLQTINPNTIESITVLKDAGETAVYGSRGANGVILIKTKKGSG